MKAFLMVYHIFIHSEANDLVISCAMHMKMIYSLFILGVKLHKRDKIRRYDVFIMGLR